MPVNKNSKLMSWAKLIAIYIGILAALVIFILAQDVFIPLLAAMIFVYLLNPIADKLEGFGIKRGLVVVIIFLGGISLIAGVGFLFRHQIMSEINTMKVQAPAYAAKLKAGLLDSSEMLENQVSFIPKGYLKNLIEEKSASLPADLAKQIPGLISKLMGVITTIIVIIFATFFFLKDGREIRKNLIRVVPNRYFETFLVLLYEINHKIGAYIRGQIIDCSIVAVLAITGLYLIGLKYGFFIGALCGAFNVIPYLGPIFGMAPAVLVAVIEHHDLLLAAKAVGVLVAVQLIDNAVISPIAVGGSMEIHPLIVILCVTFGGLLMGVWGMLLAVPMFCALKVTFEILYKGIIQYGSWENN